MKRYATATITIKVRQGVNRDSVDSIIETSAERALELLQDHEILMVPKAIYHSMNDFLAYTMNANNIEELPNGEYIYAVANEVILPECDIETEYEDDEPESEEEADDLLSD